MVTRRFYSFAVLTLLTALPLAALEGSTVKQSAPVRSGHAWEQRSEFEASAKPGGRLLLRADNGSVSIRPQSGDKVSCVVTVQVYTHSEAEARRLFGRFQLTARPLETGGVYIASQSPAQAGRGGNFRVQFEVTVPQRYNLDVETQGGDIGVEALLEDRPC